MEVKPIVQVGDAAQATGRILQRDAADDPVDLIIEIEQVLG
jgi:hypothetical protein